MAYVKSSHGYVKANDGTPLPYIHWQPTDLKVSKVVMCIPEPGIRSPQTLTLLGDFLSSKGITVYAFGLRGWEIKVGKKDDDTTMKDLTDSLDYIVWKEEGKKLFLLGMSFGCLYCLQCAYEYAEHLNGLILMAPAHNSPILEALETIEPLKLLLDRSIDFAKNLHIPTLIIQGEKDNLTKLNAAHPLFDEIVSPDKEIIFFPNAKYQDCDLFFSPDMVEDFKTQRKTILERVYDRLKRK